MTVLTAAPAFRLLQTSQLDAVSLSAVGLKLGLGIDVGFGSGLARTCLQRFSACSAMQPLYRGWLRMAKSEVLFMVTYSFRKLC